MAQPQTDLNADPVRLAAELGLSVALTSVLNTSSARFRPKAKSSNGAGFSFSMLVPREYPMIASYKVGTPHLNRKSSTTSQSARAG